MGRKNKKSITKPPSPSTSSYNDVISANSSDQHDTAPPSTPTPKPRPTPTVVAGLPALSSKRPAVTSPNASEKKSKKLKSSRPTDSLTPHNQQQFQGVVDKDLHANGGNQKEKEKEKTVEVVVDAKKNTNSIGDDGNVDFGFSREDGVMVREVMKLMEVDERNELRNKVNKANLAYLEAYLLRLNVLEVAARKAFDGIINDKF